MLPSILSTAETPRKIKFVNAGRLLTGAITSVVGAVITGSTSSDGTPK